MVQGKGCFGRGYVTDDKETFSLYMYVYVLLLNTATERGC